MNEAYTSCTICIVNASMPIRTESKQSTQKAMSLNVIVPWIRTQIINLAHLIRFKKNENKKHRLKTELKGKILIRFHYIKYLCDL